MNPNPPSTAASAGSLSGIRVIDLTSVVLGPLATQILGDDGADVVKIESLEGDPMRANGVSRHPGMSSVFMGINRNKRSLAIDLKSESGMAVARRLIERADVLVHNMRVPAIERLGLGYAAVAALNPGIVYCAATGFGQDGPYRSKPALDDIIQAACGMAALMTEATGRADYVPTLLADKTAGMAVANAVLSALFHRHRTGEGQYVEVPMFETMVEFTMAEHLGGLSFEPTAGAAGYARITGGGRRPSPAKDGDIALLPYSPSHWCALLRRVGRADLIERYALTDRNRLNAVVRDLYAELATITPERTIAEWTAICAELDIPITPIYPLDRLPSHPHLEAVGMFESHRHPSEGAVRCVRPAARFDRSPRRIRRLAPRLGEHSTQILDELGYAPGEIDALVDAGTVGCA
ncbi:MAG: CoA transferase [Comamonadaceae bacterium]|nr:MAG: CoA transferase [Comamonadaceae bacterium]